MAYLVKALDVALDTTIIIDNGKMNFCGGRLIKELPTLYSSSSKYVFHVNLWFIHLSETVKDLSSYSRALRSYWQYLEDNSMEWDNFILPKNKRPTYSWRNWLKNRAESGNLSYSTANTYVRHMVAFYIYMIDNNFLRPEKPFLPFVTKEFDLHIN